MVGLPVVLPGTKPAAATTPENVVGVLDIVDAGAVVLALPPPPQALSAQAAAIELNMRVVRSVKLTDIVGPVLVTSATFARA